MGPEGDEGAFGPVGSLGGFATKPGCIGPRRAGSRGGL